ncbi:hypothetical protein JCM10450v2_000600 [Rhodotorula kratochvilovae]
MDLLDPRTAVPHVEGKGEDSHSNGHQAALRPVSLLDLPDELLEQIFRQVFASLVPQNGLVVPGLVAPLGLISVNKRVYALNSRLWLSRVTGPVLEGQRGSFFSRLLCAPAAHTQITHLDVTLSNSTPLLSLALISHLVNLESLELDLEEGSDVEIAQEPRLLVADAIGALVRGLLHLQKLSLTAPDELPGESFRLVDTPHVVELVAQDGPWLRGALALGAPALRKVECVGVVADFRELVIPWSTLDKLALGEFDEARDLESLIDCLKAAPSIALKQVCIPFEGGDHFPARMHKLLEALGRTGLKRLQIFNITSFRWEFTDLRLPGVQTVLLNGDCAYNDGDTLQHLARFLSMFPEATEVRLLGGTFSASPSATAASDINKLDNASFCLAFPHLHG